jgi:TonB family protein
MKQAFFILFVLFSLRALAQHPYADTLETVEVPNQRTASLTIPALVNDPPFNPGDYLHKNLKYPEECHDSVPDGRVYAGFRINVRGYVDSVWILKSPPNGSCLEKEVIRVLSAMPYVGISKTKEGAVPWTFVIPIRFRVYGAVFTKEPSFKGGKDSLQHYIDRHLVYSERAKKKGREGAVQLVLTIEADGTISNVFLKKGSYACFNRAARKLARGMPRWEPGTVNRKKEAMDVRLDVEFRINEKNKLQ